MRITEISYQRVKNLGNYETERVEMVAEVNEGEDVNTVYTYLRDMVNKALGVLNDY
jgi:hypothetical protein